MGEYNEAAPSKSTTSKPPKSAPDPKPQPQIERHHAEVVARAAADILQHTRSSSIQGAPESFQLGLRMLYAGVSGRDREQQLPPKQRLASINVGLYTIAPALNFYRGDHEGREWLAKELDPYVERHRSSARFDLAMERVDNATLIDKHTVEMPDENDPRRQGLLLHQQLRKLIPSMAIVNEQVIRVGEIGIHAHAHELMHGHPHTKALGPGSLVEMQATLWGLDAYLIMTDQEFRHHLADPKGLPNQVASYSELVKVAVEAMGTAVAMTAAFAGAVAKFTGNAAWGNATIGLARTRMLKISNVIAGIEIIHGIAVLADSHASKQDKIDAGVHIASNTAWLVASKSWGGPVSFAIELGYLELKLALQAFWESSVGINSGLMRLAFETLERDARDIAVDTDRLTKVGGLMAEEKDPAKLADLHRVENVLVERLGGHVDYLLNDLKPRGFEAGIARHPGAYPILREVFSTLVGFAGARDKAKVATGARLALEKLAWAFAHAGELAIAATKQQSLADLKSDLAKEAATGEH